jgi:putative ABC transport system permease protein
LRRDAVADVWPLKFYIPVISIVSVLLLAWLMGASMLLWSVLAGAVVLALLCGVVGWLLLRVMKNLPSKHCRCVWRSIVCCASHGQR